MLNSTSLPVLRAELARLQQQWSDALSNRDLRSVKLMRAATRRANDLQPLIAEIQAKILLIEAGYTITK